MGDALSPDPRRRRFLLRRLRRRRRRRKGLPATPAATKPPAHP